MLQNQILFGPFNKCNKNKKKTIKKRNEKK